MGPAQQKIEFLTIFVIEKLSPLCHSALKSKPTDGETFDIGPQMAEKSGRQNENILEKRSLTV